MRSLYQKYKAELLTFLSILAPLLLATIWSRLTGSGFLTILYHNWLSFASLGLLLVLLIYSIRLHRKFSALSKRSLAPLIESDDKRYRDILDRTQSVYYLLGMSAEEFQRDVPLAEYFSERVRSGKPIRRLRFLLLHPDSNFFSQRLSEVNPGRELKHMIERKKEIIRSLDSGLRSLPGGTIETVELRFFDSYPIWMLQFYDQKPASTGGHSIPDALELMVHIKGTHSKYSPRYRLTDTDGVLFNSFLSYFERLWESSLPMTDDGSFPYLLAEEAGRLTDLIFDLDGTIVQSNELKRSAFLAALGPMTPETADAIDEIYRRHVALNRRELFRNVFREVKLGALSEDRLDELDKAYSNFYLTHLDSVTVSKGFATFHERFKNRYRLSIVSNAPQQEILPTLQALKMEDWFLKVYGYPTRKATAIREILDDYTLNPENALYVGDTVEDRIVAEAIGIRFCVINPDDIPPEMSSDSVSSFDELATFIYEIDLGR
jgi:phosphoglycolate phosphatase-like HAD superfamily hydrolase